MQAHFHAVLRFPITDGASKLCSLHRHHASPETLPLHSIHTTRRKITWPYTIHLSIITGATPHSSVLHRRSSASWSSSLLSTRMCATFYPFASRHTSLCYPQRFVSCFTTNRRLVVPPHSLHLLYRCINFVDR